MKTALAMGFVLVLGGGAFAQAGSIGLFSDPGGQNYYLLDLPPAGLKTYYVVHVYTNGATASQYRAQLPTCMTGAVWLSDTNVYPVSIGNSQTGFSTSYGACKVGPIHTQIINVFGQGLALECCFWHVTADPMVPSGKIEASDCDYQLMYPTGGTGVVNPNVFCTDPVEDKTWGRVKALFVE